MLVYRFKCKITSPCVRWLLGFWPSVQRLIQHTRPHAALYFPKGEQALLLFFFADAIFCLLRRWRRSSRDHVGLSFHWLVLGVSLRAGTLHRLMLLWQSRRLTPVTHTAQQTGPSPQSLISHCKVKGRSWLPRDFWLTNHTVKTVIMEEKKKVAKSTLCKRCRVRGQKEIGNSDVSSVNKYG